MQRSCKHVWGVLSLTKDVGSSAFDDKERLSGLVLQLRHGDEKEMWDNMPGMSLERRIGREHRDVQVIQ